MYFTLMLTIFLLANLGVIDSVLFSNDIIHRKSLYRNIYSKYEGDIYLAALFSIHHAGSKPKCGRIIDQDGLQVIAATTFGLKMVKDQLNLPINIGMLAIDTCQDPIYGLEQSKDFLLFKSCRTDETFVCMDNKTPTVKEEYKSLQRVFGIFGAGNSDVSILVATFLRIVELPQISYFSTSPELSDEIKYPDFFRTIPSDNMTVQAIVGLLRRFKWNFPLIISDDSSYSVSTKERLSTFVAQTNYRKNTLCISKNVIILSNKHEESMKTAIKHISDHLRGVDSPKVVVTILSQSVIEDLLNYIENYPVEEFSKLIWISTDSWGGRKWPNITKNNPLLNNSISIIPNSYEMKEFNEYYSKRLPSKDDYDPWLAEKFEQVCNCQYSDTSLFIYPELLKMRSQISGTKPCESLESECSKFVFQDSEQMPYIHYVVDGILAYAYTIKTLIGDKCNALNRSACADYIWTNKVIDSENITKVLKNVHFTDYQKKTFYFWKEREGVPNYSILFFNKYSEKWDNVGHISGYSESKNLFNIQVDSTFEEKIKNEYSVEACSPSCDKGEKRIYTVDTCCWTCEKCPDKHVVNKSKSACSKCQDGQWSDIMKNECKQMTEVFMNPYQYGALIIILGNIFGLMLCIFTFVILSIYFKTPIIKAFGKETGFIILLGTIFSFSFSIALLDRPNTLRCYMYWFTPAFCNTLCYAAVLTKTNRIVKIFGINWSSKKKNNPRFISPLSQISIIAVITLVESCIIVIISILADVRVEKLDKDRSIAVLCMKMNAGNLLSVFLIPTLLLLFTTFYAFKMRKTPDGFNETRNINFMNFANCIVLVTSLFLYELLDNFNAVYPLCLQMTLGAYSNLICLFAPRIYLVLCRPEKNTVENVIARNRSRSTVSFSQPNVTDMNSNINKGNVRCRKCNTIIIGSTSSDKSDDIRLPEIPTKKEKPQQKVFFTENEFNDKNYPANKTTLKVGKSNDGFTDDNL